jgi:multicomponent Na+:H+ antiporter subunit E
MEKFKSRSLLFVILFFFWVLWNNTMDFKIWLYGVIPSLLVVLFFGQSITIFNGVKLTPKSFFYSFVYIVVFVWALIKSNIDVLLRVLNPKLPINPGIVKIKTNIKSPMGRLILANSITLTPGTFVVDIKEEFLYIHWIDVSCENSIEEYSQAISGTFENLLLKIYE